ncbi:MAG: PAS domain-containing protein [Salinivirgaceae bacterium]
MITDSYWDEYPSAVTICNQQAIIVYMNQKAQQTFEKWGGKSLIGKSLIDCHNPKSKEKIEALLATGIPNTYTIEKLGKKKLIHQSPWFNQGQIAGLIEISIELPATMPHFIR